MHGCPESDVVVSQGTEHSAETLSNGEGGSGIVIVGIEEVLEFEEEATSSTGKELGGTLPGDEVSHGVEELIDIAVSVKSSLEGDLVLHHNLEFRPVPGEVDVRHNVHKRIQGDQRSLDGREAQVSSSGDVHESVSRSKDGSEETVQVLVGLLNVGAGTNTGKSESLASGTDAVVGLVNVSSLVGIKNNFLGSVVLMSIGSSNRDSINKVTNVLQIEGRNGSSKGKSDKGSFHRTQINNYKQFKLTLFVF